MTRTEHEKIFVSSNGFVPALESFQKEIDGLVRLAEGGKTEELRARLAEIAQAEAGFTAEHAGSAEFFCLFLSELCGLCGEFYSFCFFSQRALRSLR
mgnify:CR=1 FL=1